MTSSWRRGDAELFGGISLRNIVLITVNCLRAYYTYGEGGKLPPLGAGGIPPIVRARILLARNLVFSRRKMALTLLYRTRYILLYIKTPILEFEMCFSIRYRENNA